MSDTFARLWVAATGPELACAPGASEAETIPGTSPWNASRRGDVAFLATGAGPVSAAAALGWFLGVHSVRSIVGIGIAGLFVGSPCRRTDVHRVVRECFPDLGAESPGGEVLTLDFPGLRDREFPLDCPADLGHLPTAAAATVAVATGTASTALRRRATTGADLESMEGASWAFVASRWNIPFAEVRSISNIAGFRNRSDWDIPGALERLRDAISRGRAQS
jgi:futalosine hydrolase